MKHWHQVQQELSMFISFQNITDKHPYYANLGSLAWQNSIRHNLSLLPEFVKVGGTSGKGPGGGKGHLWTIKPGVDEQRLASLFRDEQLQMQNILCTALLQGGCVQRLRVS